VIAGLGIAVAGALAAAFLRDRESSDGSSAPGRGHAVGPDRGLSQDTALSPIPEEASPSEPPSQAGHDSGSARDSIAGFLASSALILCVAVLAIAAALGMRAWLWPDMPIALPLLVALIFVIGMVLWWAGRRDEGSRSNLGAALLSGTLIAVAVFGFQWSAEQQRQRLAARQSIQLTIAFQKDLTGIDLSGADLSRLYLRGKILKEANLEGSRLRNARMDGANLESANLKGANLGGAVLAAAHLKSASLQGANLADSNFQGADLSYASFGPRVAGSTLIGQKPQGSDLSGVNFNGASLRNASFADGIELNNVDLTYADLRGTNLSLVRLGRADFFGALADDLTHWPDSAEPNSLGLYLIVPGANLQKVSLANRIIPDAALYQADLREADLRGTNLKNVNLVGAALTGADLRAADLTAGNLTNAKLARALVSPNTRLPRTVNLRALGAYPIRSGADLRRADLRGRMLVKENLQRSLLGRADLRRANMRDTNLRDSKLIAAKLSRANLAGANLTSADLTEANLVDAVADSDTRWPKGFDPRARRVLSIEPGANLRGARLSRQDLTSMDFQDVDLSGADLRKADLSGADLHGAKLSRAVLKGAIVDYRTAWPVGFDPWAAGVLVSD
jgi:uncharacterized protein YjbI with pentapeptide repeats